MLLRRKHKIDNPVASKMRDKVAQGIAVFLLSLQSGFASFMNERINMLGKKSKQVFLIVFCSAFGGLSIYAFTGAFRTDRPTNVIRPSQLSVPRYYDQTDGEIEVPMVTEGDIIRITRFQKYMDSLSQSANGKLLYDSILKARPGLMDSIQAIQKIYYSQSK